MDGPKIWNRVLRDIKSSLAESSYKTWFSGSSVLEYKVDDVSKILVVSLKNNFIKEQVEKKYSTLVDKIMTNAVPGGAKVVFVVNQKDELPVKSGPLFSGVAQQVFAKTINPSSIIPEYSFSNFVVGPSNNLAYYAARKVCEAPAISYNPLFLYGPTGVGKTHLLHALGNDLLRSFVDFKILYVTSEKFTNDYIQSLQNKTTGAFRDKYRKVDLLLVDDVQFFAGKESTQDEFFYTFNELALSGKQLVLASDRHPKELTRLKERLSSRFLGGIACDINLPDLEMKIAILTGKCKVSEVVLESEVVRRIAESSEGVRELEGNLTSVIALIKMSGGKIEQEKIVESLEKGERAGRNRSVTPEQIIFAVCKHFNTSQKEIISPSRRAHLVMARQILMYLLKKELGLSLEYVGELLGGRDHSTVIYGIEKIRKQISSDRNLSDEVLRVKSLIATF